MAWLDSDPKADQYIPELLDIAISGHLSIDHTNNCTFYNTIPTLKGDNKINEHHYLYTFAAQFSVGNSVFFVYITVLLQS